MTVDEFPLCQRHLPIVFSAGADPVPLALMGLNEGVNTMVDAEGKLRRDDGYVPGYIRRYPWMLAKLDPSRDELSLCFDPTVDYIGEFDDGERLIEDDGTPSTMTTEILAFCEQFEQAARRTQQFMADIKELDLLMDGELSIQVPNSDQPYIYRGFQMISEDKLRELRGDQLRKANQSGALAMIHAHLFSLQLNAGKFSPGSSSSAWARSWHCSRPDDTGSAHPADRRESRGLPGARSSRNTRHGAPYARRQVKFGTQIARGRGLAALKFATD